MPGVRVSEPNACGPDLLMCVCVCVCVCEICMLIPKAFVSQLFRGPSAHARRRGSERPGGQAPPDPRTHTPRGGLGGSGADSTAWSARALRGTLIGHWLLGHARITDHADRGLLEAPQETARRCGGVCDCVSPRRGGQAHAHSISRPPSAPAAHCDDCRSPFHTRGDPPATAAPRPACRGGACI